MKHLALRLYLIASIFLSACGATIGGGIFDVGDWVWLDTNGNGIQDEGEPGVPGVTVKLYYVDPDSGALSLDDQQMTDAGGFYLFKELLDEEIFVLEFVPPPDLRFTQRDEGDSDAKDSDADPSTGRTEQFTIIGDDPDWDAGLISAGSSLTPAPTNTPTPLIATYTDPEDDTENCETQAALSDGEVDIVQVTISRAGGLLVVQVFLRIPLTNDYSFAILLFIIYSDEFLTYLWEIHATVLRIGQTDSITGELLTLQPQGLRITYASTLGQPVSFSIPLESLPKVVDQLALRSFHTPMEGDPKSCDFLEPVDIP